MPRHLRHYGWLYLTLLVLIAWPAFVIRSQSGPPMDVPTLRRMVTIYRDGFVRAHPQLQVKDMRERTDTHFQHDAPYIDRVLGFWPVNAPAMPVLKSDVERLAQREAAHFAELDDLAARGGVYCPFPPGNATASDTTATLPELNALVPDFLGIQILCKIRRAEARLAIEERRWNDALRLLESAAHIGATVRYESVIGSLIAVATRAITYGGYTELLHAGPPPEVQRAALASLLALRASDPVLDEWTWACERSYAILTSLLSSERTVARPGGLPAVKMPSINSQGTRILYMLQAGKALVRLRDRIQDPALRSQADALAARYPSLSDENMFPDIGTQHMKWTMLPAVRKCLVKVARKEPWIYRDSMIPEKETEGLDPWTMTLASTVLLLWANTYLEGASTRGRTVETMGALLRAAFAANLYRERHDAWPTDLDDLAEFRAVPEEARPTTTTGAAASTSTGTLRLPTEPFLPIRFAECEVTDEIRQTLWGTILPRSALPRQDQRGHSGIGPDGLLEWTISDGSSPGLLKQPVLIVAIAEGFNAHPRLVEWAKPEVGNKKIVSPTMPRTMPPAAGEFGEWRPLEAAFARRITDEADREQERAAEAARGAAGTSGAATAARAPETTATQPAAQPILALRLTAKLRAPEKVMVVWSPGPDGVDDGGAISYDVTNGTMSRGDIIVYPEKF